GCISNPPAVYAIDISAANAVPDGTATRLFYTSQFDGICNALAWDTANKIVYTQDGNTITRFKEFPDGEGGSFWNEVLPDFSSETTTCSDLNGLAASNSLFAACGSTGEFTGPTIKQLNKNDGTVISSFAVSLPIGAGVVGNPEDLECDPLSFPGKSVIWTTARSTNTLFAVESPACGLGGGPPPPGLSCVNPADTI